MKGTDERRYNQWATMAPSAFPFTLVTITLFATATTTNAFSPAYVAPSKLRQQQQHRHFFAYIFGAEGEEDSSEFDDDSKATTMFAADEKASEDLVSKMNTIPDLKAKLARCAAGFPPEGQSIQLKHIQDVSILRITHEFIELSVVVAESDFAVTVAVAILFPTPCTPDIPFEDCVIQNIEIIDQQAQAIIRQKEYEEQNYEAIQAYQREAQELMNLDNFKFPSWWPTTGEVMAHLETECVSLKSLLNEEDFQGEMRKLAAHGIRLQIGEDYYLVGHARIATISSAGIVVAARIQEPQEDDEEGENDTIKVDIPIPFGFQAGDVDQLRETVISMVEET